MLLITVAKLLLALASLQDPTPQTPGPLMWTPDLKVNADVFEKVGLPTPDEKRAGEYAASLRARLKALITRTEVQRNFAESLIPLDYLRAGACWSLDYPGKAEIAAEIATTRADWLEKLGKHKEAVFAAWHPYVMPEETSATAAYACWHWTASNGSLVKLLNTTDALAAIVELHQRFPSDAPATKGGDAIDEVVRNTIAHGDPQTLKDFGTRCVPALQQAILDGTDELSERLNTLSDPLSVLFAIDRKSAENLILATVGKRSPAWTLRVIRALGNSSVTGASWVNSPDPLQPPRFDDPLTLQMIDLLAAQPMSALGFFALLAPLVRNDAITPAIQSYLLEHTQASDPQVISILLDMLDGQTCGPNKRALYEAFLESSNPELRLRCAKAMRHYPVGPATLRATQHSDPNVRSQVLHALVRHFESPRRYWSGNAPESIEYAVASTPEIAAALLRLARDPERRVRTELIVALQESREEPPAAVLELLLADSDPEVRQAAAWNWSFKPELQARVLARLAGDQARQVLYTVGYALNHLAPRSEASPVEFELYLPALARWLSNPELDTGRDPNAGPTNPIRGAMMSPKGARVAFEACVRGPRHEQLTPLLLELLRWTRNEPKEGAIYDVLDSPSIAELFALSCTAGRRDQVAPIEQILSFFVGSRELDAQPFLALAADEHRPREVRLRALRLAAAKGGPEFKERLFSFLRGAQPEESMTKDSSGSSQFELLTSAAWAWPDLGENLGELCMDTKIGDLLALRVASSARKWNGSAFDAPTTRACLQRWARLDEGAKGGVVDVLYFLDPRVDAAVLELWKAGYRDRRFSQRIVTAMGKFPIDESVSMLAEAVGAEWMSTDSDQRDIVRNSAISALTTRLDDLGADALLKAIAGAPNEETRKKCFDGLEQIRKYQDEKQSWQKRKGGEAAREQAIADLLPMLTDKDAIIRAAAARSLATLQAVEHLPKLVALLKDKDASVREAAQKALDALNAPAAKKP